MVYSQIEEIIKYFIIKSKILMKCFIRMELWMNILWDFIFYFLLLLFFKFSVFFFRNEDLIKIMYFVVWGALKKGFRLKICLCFNSCWTVFLYDPVKALIIFKKNTSYMEYFGVNILNLFFFRILAPKSYK